MLRLQKSNEPTESTQNSSNNDTGHTKNFIMVWK